MKPIKKEISKKFIRILYQADKYDPDFGFLVFIIPGQKQHINLPVNKSSPFGVRAQKVEIHNTDIFWPIDILINIFENENLLISKGENYYIKIKNQNNIVIESGIPSWVLG